MPHSHHPPKLTLIHTLPVDTVNAQRSTQWAQPISLGFERKPALVYNAAGINSITIESSIAEELNGMVKPDSLPLMVEKISQLMTHKLQKQNFQSISPEDYPKTPA